MKIAIVSDTHDHVWTLEAALRRLHEEADLLICCGDLCSPFMVTLMAEKFSGPIHIVAGNNEGDWWRITRNASRFAHIHLHGEFMDEAVEGKRIAAVHYPELARLAAQSGEYDLVCYGHDHRFAIERRGSTLLVNPGTLLGYDPIRQQDVPATFMVYETQTDDALGYQVVRKMAVEAAEQRITPYS